MTKENILKKIKGNSAIYKYVLILQGRRNIFSGFVKKKIKGADNQIKYKKNVLFSKVTFNVDGNNNTINIEDLCVFNNVLFYIRGNNNKIYIANDVKFNNGGSIWIDDNDCNIIIDSNTTFENTNLALSEPKTRIIIGKDCMFAYDIDLRTGDSHSIKDIETYNKLNLGKNIKIGNHVWIASHVSILKGVELAENIVVATRSLVTKSFKNPGVIIGGNPAQIIKENITWTRERT